MVQNLNGFNYCPPNKPINSEESKALLELTEQELFLKGVELQNVEKQLNTEMKEKALLKDTIRVIEEIFKNSKGLMGRTINSLVESNEFISRKVEVLVNKDNAKPDNFEDQKFQDLFFDPFQNKVRCGYTGPGGKAREIVKKNQRCIEEIKLMQIYPDLKDPSLSKAISEFLFAGSPPDCVKDSQLDLLQDENLLEEDLNSGEFKLSNLDSENDDIANRDKQKATLAVSIDVSAGLNTECMRELEEKLQ